MPIRKGPHHPARPFTFRFWRDIRCSTSQCSISGPLEDDGFTAQSSGSRKGKDPLSLGQNAAPGPPGDLWVAESERTLSEPKAEWPPRE